MRCLTLNSKCQGPSIHTMAHYRQAVYTAHARTSTHRTTTVTLAHARREAQWPMLTTRKQNSWVSENCTLPPRNTFVNTTKFTKVFTYASFYQFPPIQHVYTVTPILMQQLLTLSSIPKLNNNYFPGLVGKQEMCIIKLAPFLYTYKHCRHCKCST